MPLEAATPIQNLTSVITALLGWFDQVFDIITAEPILLIGFGVFTIGACIGLVKRLLG